MVKATTPALLFLLAVAACSTSVDGRPGDDSALVGAPESPPSRQVLTGVLAGNAAGIHYRTQQLEGLTDASGTFTYLAGETVSFHVGGIVLGSAIAAPRLDLFQIAGGPVPSTELELVSAVLDTATMTGIDRAANAAMVLLAFDHDDDPSNGIELRGTDLALAGKTLTLERELGDFGALLTIYAQRAGVPWNAVEPADAVAYIYASIEVRIPAHARRVTFTDDHPSDPAHDFMTTTTYDDAGRELLVDDVPRDPQIPGSSTLVARDAHGREIRRETVSTDVPARTYAIATRRDVRGQPLLATETNLEGALLRYSRTDAFSVDATGRIVAYELRTDLDGDATPDEHAKGSYAYEAALVRYDTTFESDVSLEYRTSLEMDFDAAGLLVGKREIHDYGMDGVNDLEYRGEFQRDARGLLLAAKETRRSSASTAPRASTTTYTRDTDGRVVRTDTTYADSPQRDVLEVYFDSEHRTAGELRTSDTDGDGVANSREIVEILRDGDGNVSSRQTTTTAHIDGADVVIRRAFISQVFENGAPLARLQRFDNDGDGVFDSEQSRRYEYSIIPDGARYIVENAARWVE